MGVLSTPLIKVGGALAPLAPPSAAHAMTCHIKGVGETVVLTM